MDLVSVSIKICIWQKDRTQLNQFSRYTLYTYNIFTSLRLSSLYTSCPRTIQSWTALTWRCLEERNGSISRRSGAPAYRAMFRQLAFFDFIGSLEIYFDFLAIFDGLRSFLANPVRLSGSVGEIFEVCLAVRTNLGQSGTTLSGWIWRDLVVRVEWVPHL